ncbi:MAG: exo-alpha-sialidase [Planctomycetes bacterium]|nr:exo-alpha-sialidase [Planctomycetota bacterium]
MSDRMYVGTRKGLFALDRTGAGWSITDASFLGDKCSMLLHDPRDGALYAALDHGHFGAKMHRSRDGGATWDELPAPVYPEPPAGYEPRRTPDGGKHAPWNLKFVWELQAGGPDQEGRLWCGTLPGGLFRSDDHGASWELVRSLWDLEEREEWFGGGYDYPGIHSVCVDPRNHDDVVLGVSCGGAWRTTDGGATWMLMALGMRAEYMPPERAGDGNIQDPHLIVQCPSDPDALWTQHHNGIFRSTDRAGSWTEIENVAPSNFGFAVAVHPHDANTAWFVPAVKDEHRIPVDGKLVVTRTRDGGRSFEQLRGGLPQDHAYDLVFRHALDVDETGDRLAFGSTTGSLWTTENGGDAWNCVSANLPPVHVVRFVK